MAWIERRDTAAGMTYRVVWRQEGLTAKQQQTFAVEDDALELRDAVNRAGQRWPRNYVPGKGWRDQIQHDVPLFRHYAERTINARTKADERTRGDYLGMIERHLNPVLGDVPVDEIDRFHVAAVAQRAIGAKKAAKTIANIHGLLSSILADAVADDLVRRNVAQGAMPDVPDVKTEDMVFLTHADFATIAAALPEGGPRDLARLLVGTGLRWSEATALQPGDLDLAVDRVLHVRRAWKYRDGRFELGEPKTKRSRRSIGLSPALIDLLKPYVVRDGRFVFETANGQPVRHANYRYQCWVPALFAAQNCAEHREAATAAHREYRLALRRARRTDRGDGRTELEEKPPAPCGCPGTLGHTPRIHDLRHTHASWLLADKIDLVAIQRRLGHESIQTTIDRYSHLAPSHIDEINASVDRALRAG